MSQVQLRWCEKQRFFGSPALIWNENRHNETAMTDPHVTVFHNPACGTSRRVLELVKATGRPATVVEYLKVGWTVDQLRELLNEAGLTPRDALREKGELAAELGLLATDVTDETILLAMVEHPVLVNRPIVRTSLGTALCRPAEKVLGLLGGPSSETAANG
jgi:arsenate reductase